MAECALDSILERAETEKPAKYSELKQIKDKKIQNLEETPLEVLAKLAECLLIYLDLNSLDDLFTKEIREKGKKNFSLFLQLARFDIKILHLHLFKSHLATLESLREEGGEKAGRQVFGFCVEAV